MVLYKILNKVNDIQNETTFEDVTTQDDMIANGKVYTSQISSKKPTLSLQINDTDKVTINTTSVDFKGLNITNVGIFQITELETLTVNNNMIIVNDGLNTTPNSTMISGIEVERGNLTNYQFLFRESDSSFCIGLKSNNPNNLQPVLTKNTTLVNNSLLYYDSSNYRANNSSSLSFNPSSKTLSVPSIFQEIQNTDKAVRIINTGSGNAIDISSPDVSKSFIINSNCEIVHNGQTVLNSTMFNATNISCASNLIGNVISANTLFSTNSTLTNITSTNINTSNFTSVNARITNTTSTNLSATNITSTNINTSNITSTNAYISSMLVQTQGSTTPIQIINSGTGNNIDISNSAISPTRTFVIDKDLNVFVGSGSTLQVAGNTTTLNLFSTNSTLTNITSTNINTSNFTSVNGFITNSTISNIFATNSTLTNVTSTNINTSNFTTVNGFITNSTISNITGTNCFITNATHSSLFSTNSTLTSVTSTNINTSNFTTVNGFITNSTHTNLFATNATFNSINATSVSISTGQLNYFPNTYITTTSLTMNLTTHRNGCFVEFTGSTGQTITFPNPTQCSGYMFTLWNNSGNTLNFTTPSGAIFIVNIGSAPTTVTSSPLHRSYNFQSDGFNWIAVGGKY